MSSSAIKDLMSDANIIDRFTEYICNGMFKYAEPWIRQKYLKYRQETKPFETENFFVRMQKDLKKRHKEKVQREEKSKIVQKDLSLTFMRTLTKKGRNSPRGSSYGSGATQSPRSHIEA